MTYNGLQYREGQTELNEESNMPKSAAKRATADQPNPAVLTKQEFSPAFISKAKEAEKQIISRITALSKEWTRIIKAIRQFKDKGYHVAVGYPNFGDWVHATFGRSAAQVFADMRIIRELGEIVPEKDLNQMTKENAEGLVKLQHQGVKITETLIHKAKALPARRFQTEIVMPKLKTEAQTGEPGPTGPTMTPTSAEYVERVGPYELEQSVAERWKKAMDVARWQARMAGGEKFVGDRRITSDQQCIDMIAGEYLSMYEADYEAYRQQEAQAEIAHAHQVDAGGDDEPEPPEPGPGDEQTMEAAEDAYAERQEPADVPEAEGPAPESNAAD